MPLLYCAGCLKNVSNETKNQRSLAQRGAIGSLTMLCRSLLGAGSKSKRTKDLKRLCQLTIQATAVLRNLALDKRHLKQFWDSGTVQVLCALADGDSGSPGFVENTDLVLNVSRILAKLSLYEQGREAIMEADGVGSLLQLVVNDHPHHAALAVRVFFILGNLTAGNDENRMHVGEGLDGAVFAVSLVERFGEEYTAICTQEGSGEGEDILGVEDVLIKLVRFVANMSIDAQLGMKILKMGPSALFDVLVLAAGRHKHLVEVAADSRDRVSAEELVLNLVAAITNLLFHDDSSSSELDAELRTATPVLVDLLLSPNEECVLEALRALGNISKKDAMRREFHVQRIDEIVVVLLEHDSFSVVYGACGVLLNMASYGPTRARLSARQLGGVDKLICLLEGRRVASAKLEDLGSLISIVCQTIFNYTLGNSAAKTIRDRIGGKLLSSERRRLASILNAISDEASGNALLSRARKYAATLLDRVERMGATLEYKSAWGDDDEGCRKRDGDEVLGTLQRSASATDIIHDALIDDEDDDVWEPLA